MINPHPTTHMTGTALSVEDDAGSRINFWTFSQTHISNAGRRTKFASVKSLDSSEFSSEFSDLKTLSSNVKVNPVIS